MTRADKILDFWIDEVGENGWYVTDEDLDQRIRDEFLDDWQKAVQGKYDDWACDPTKSLALIILLDQFPRNMFREDARAFKADKKARCKAKKAIESGFDLRTPEPQRQFYYLPLMHSENLTDQERCIRLMRSRMPEYGESNLLHAKAHREIIRRFGRFPYRNEVLERPVTPMEQAFIDSGGYGATVEELNSPN